MSPTYARPGPPDAAAADEGRAIAWDNRAMDSETLRPPPAVGPDLGGAARRAGLALAFIAGYVALDWLSYIHPMQQYSITPWNPQPALAIGLVMLRGQRWLPVVFAAVVIAEWAVRGAPAAWPYTLMIAAVLALGYAAIARALTGRFAVHPGLETAADALRLVAVVTVGALGTGVLYVGALVASGVGPLDEPFVALFRFWIGDAGGILVALPIVLMSSVPARRAQARGMAREPRALGYAAATALALAIVFAAAPAEQVKHFYVLFLPLVLVASRYGMVGASAAAVAIQGAVVGTGELVGYPSLTVFELQALLIALTVTGLFLGVAVDQRRRAEDELRRTLRIAAAGEMAAALAHELNQPLTAVASYARAGRLIAQDPAADPTLLAGTLDKLVAESTRAADVVRRLRDFFRAGSTQLAPMSLEQVAGRALAAVRRQAEAADVALALRVPEPIPDLLADATQVEIVLRNLLANAVEAAAAGPAPRAVGLELAAHGEHAVRASVVDSGHGVAPADVEHIFEPFETRRAKGMGMGLAIARAIVEAHGGRLWAEAAPRGIFRFTLPVGEPHDG